MQRIPSYFLKNVKLLGIFKNSINGEFCQVCTALLTKSIYFQVGCNLTHPRVASCPKQVFFYFQVCVALLEHPRRGLLAVLTVKYWLNSHPPDLLLYKICDFFGHEGNPPIGGSCWQLLMWDHWLFYPRCNISLWPGNAISKLTAFSEEMNSAILKNGLIWLF